MKTPILIVAIVGTMITTLGFGQMNYGAGAPPVSQPSQQTTAGQPNTSTTTTKTTYPQGVKGYLDQQMAGSKDKKFHVSVNGKDLAMTPIKTLLPTPTSGFF